MKSLQSRPADLASLQAVSHVLGPGDVCLARQGEVLQTLLGSCVALILTDPARTLATMCHIVHAGPDRSGRQDTLHADPAWRAMEKLLLGQGLNPRLCQACLYGGANMFPALFGPSHVGADNVDWALRKLAAQGIALLASDVGGQSYRRLSWRVGPGLPQVTHGPWQEGCA